VGLANGFTSDRIMKRGSAKSEFAPIPENEDELAHARIEVSGRKLLVRHFTTTDDDIVSYFRILKAEAQKLISIELIPNQSYSEIFLSIHRVEHRMPN
jgi:hypothetical protein